MSVSTSSDLEMTTRFLGNRPIRHRKPSGPAAAAGMPKENKENSPYKSPCKNRLEDDDKGDVAGEDTLLAMLNESKTPDRTVMQLQIVFIVGKICNSGGTFRIPAPSR